MTVDILKIKLREWIRRLDKAPAKTLFFLYADTKNVNREPTWACLNMPGWYSSNQSTCQTNSEPSMGWMLNSTSALLFHSSSSTSTWCLTAASESSTASAPWGSPGLLLVSSSSRFSSSSGSGGECKSWTPYLRHLRVIGKKKKQSTDNF